MGREAEYRSAYDPQVASDWQTALLTLDVMAGSKSKHAIVYRLVRKRIIGDRANVASYGRIVALGYAIGGDHEPGSP